MKVILKEQVKNLGGIGEVVNVTAGYARNFLIPRQFAVVADETNKDFVEDQKRRLAKKIDSQKAVALEIKRKIDETSIELIKRIGGNGKLFGAVTANELSKALHDCGVDIETRWINFEQPIKDLGTFDVNVKLFKGVVGVLKVKVMMDPKQAEEIKKKSEMKKVAAAKKALDDAAAAKSEVEGTNDEDSDQSEE